MKIVVVSKHWLWSYDLHMLNDFSKDYDALRKSDNSLTEGRCGRHWGQTLEEFYGLRVLLLAQSLSSLQTEFVVSDCL